MQKCTLIGLMMIFLVLLVPVKVTAEEAEHGSKEEGLEHRHHDVELFLGNTHDSEDDGFTIGLGYEYRLSQLFGIGGIVEYAGIDIKEWFLAVPFIIHPYKGWRFLVAPGVAIPRDKDNEELFFRKDFFFRVGAAYEFEIGEKWALIPAFNVDFSDHKEVLVFGLGFGHKF